MNIKVTGISKTKVRLFAHLHFSPDTSGQTPSSILQPLIDLIIDLHFFLPHAGEEKDVSQLVRWDSPFPKPCENFFPEKWFLPR